MRYLIYDPLKQGKRMTIACFISGSGTNYREIAARDPGQNYVVFTNRPGCDGTAIARANGHKVVELSHAPYLKEARLKYGAGRVPRNCPEREKFERDLCALVESSIGGQPDLVCLAGYDQWLTDWIVDRYYPRMINVHPGDTTRGYTGLHWLPSARAVLAGEESVRSTLFFVDKGEDTGPVLLQSVPLSVREALRQAEAGGMTGLLRGLSDITSFARRNGIKTCESFQEKASVEMVNLLAQIGTTLQSALKVMGDWKIYPFAVHDLIAPGRVALEGRTVYVDGKALPASGYRAFGEKV